MPKGPAGHLHPVARCWRAIRRSRRLFGAGASPLATSDRRPSLPVHRYKRRTRHGSTIALRSGRSRREPPISASSRRRAFCHLCSQRARRRHAFLLPRSSRETVPAVATTGTPAPVPPRLPCRMILSRDRRLINSRFGAAFCLSHRRLAASPAGWPASVSDLRKQAPR